MDGYFCCWLVGSLVVFCLVLGYFEVTSKLLQLPVNLTSLGLNFSIKLLIQCRDEPEWKKENNLVMQMSNL